MATLEETAADVMRHLAELGSLFAPGVKLTFIARLPGNDNTDIVISSDTAGEALKVLERTIKREEGRERG